MSISADISEVVTEVGPFIMTPTSLIIDGEPTAEQWKECGRHLSTAERSVLWWVGDWLLYGEFRWRESYAKAAGDTGLAKSTLKQARRLASLFKTDDRSSVLGFRHHVEVAALPPRISAKMLKEAEANEYTVKELREVVREYNRALDATAADAGNGCTVDDLQKLIDAGRKFGCIYADPPWQYGNQGTRAATDNHYDTMTNEALAELPIGELAADKCHLHLWTTESFLEAGIHLLKHWGFERKSGFIWVKPQLGIGNYWRCSHEIMLLGVRGGLTFPPNGEKSWLEHRRTQHSAKPEAVRVLIEKMSQGPYLELFGRKVVDGWTVWGNEIERGIFDQGAKAL